MDLNDTALGHFSYLNNTRDVLIDDSMFLAPFVNYPYKIARSLYSAILSQYKSQAGVSFPSDSAHLGASTLVETAGYFFSNYAIGCFVTAMVLNRIVAMASLRSSSHVARLPLWSRLFFHACAIVALVYNVTLTLRPFADEKPFVDTHRYFALTYGVICFSHCIETFVTTTTNLKPMEEFDYSIFELSMHFYALTRSNPHPEDFIPDCLMALLGRLIIHSVELMNKRDRRLLLSTILNIGHLVYLTHRVYTLGTDSLPLLVRYRHLPKFLALFCTAVSLVCYALACIARMSPFSPSEEAYDTSDLQFHSFINNWYATLNCTGEEEFTSTLIKLAIMICNPEQTKRFGLHRELSQLKQPGEIHKSFFVSGYNSKWQSMPHDTVEDGITKPGRTVWQRKVTAIRDLLVALFRRLKATFGKSSTDHVNEDFSEGCKKNLNDFVSERNYIKFLSLAPDLNSNRIKSNDLKYLLPEDDFSADYLASDEECSEEFPEEFGSEDEESELGDVPLTDLIVPPNSSMSTRMGNTHDMKWFYSMWSILSCELQHDKRLTRSQYSELNEPGILHEVMMERITETGLKTEAKDKSERDMACVVCKTNARNIVLWPCKCFALCEECRVSLGLRGFKTCICCRTDVRGYSKINAV
ncbi:LAQU0S07e02168g1_1 [Lachancea quebecensis]|uniref:LAQU0S07e02168g1_1 n=1 Tax=Lachancea quebecensis TaxID=1654605 RepID=A0A0P1KSR0_9SACH|nr:LAQU0S07e02168g1_1 [Lachancea quebecensis]